MHYLSVRGVGTHQRGDILLGVIHRNDSSMETLSADILDDFQPFVVRTGLHKDVIKVGEDVVLSGRGHHLANLFGVLYTGTDGVVDVVDLLAEHRAVHYAAVHNQHVVSVLKRSFLVGSKRQEI